MQACRTVAGAVLTQKRTSSNLSLSSWLTIGAVMSVFITIITVMLLLDRYSHQSANQEAQIRLTQLA